MPSSVICARSEPNRLDNPYQPTHPARRASLTYPCYNRDVNTLEKHALEVHQRLLMAYGEPVWQNHLPPLDQLISTILSQNTNDVNRDRAFRTLRVAFPTWEQVRDAPPAEVVQAIRSAGLANQKGPRIQRVLKEITAERGNLDLEFLQRKSAPEVRDWLLRFKGVGPKTASIVMLFSLQMPSFPVDTHIYRVTGRLGLRPLNASAEKAHEILGALFPQDTYYTAHLNLIRHGRQVCHARKPDCQQCVLKELCADYKMRLDADHQVDSP